MRPYCYLAASPLLEHQLTTNGGRQMGATDIAWRAAGLGRLHDESAGVRRHLAPPTQRCRHAAVSEAPVLQPCTYCTSPGPRQACEHALQAALSRSRVFAADWRCPAPPALCAAVRTQTSAGKPNALAAQHLLLELAYTASEGPRGLYDGPEHDRRSYGRRSAPREP